MYRLFYVTMLAGFIVLNINLYTLSSEIDRQFQALNYEHNILRKQLSDLRVMQDHLDATQESLADQIRQWLDGYQSMVVHGTAYTAHDPGMDGRGITFTGTKATEWRTVAVDPKVISLNSAIYIPLLRDTPSRGWYRAEDTGGAIKGHKIDIFIPDRREALRFGRQTLVIYAQKTLEETLCQ